MNAPKDEMMSTSQEDRDREAKRRTRLGCCGSALVAVALLGFVLWALVGCAGTSGETQVEKELRARWTRQKVRELREAEKGQVFRSP
jgi:hypothetical protein